jgi:hypothetical protein
MNWYETQWAKRGYVAVGALLVFVLERYAANGTIDLQAVAGELAAQLKGLTVGATAAWLLTDRPEFMRPKEVQEDEP